MIIRDDIYPNLRDTLLWQRNKVLNNYLDEASNALNRFFHSREEIIKYINSFSNREDAELFLDVCGFYNIAKNYACHPFLKFIMMVSVMERLCVPEYISFADWLVRGETKKIIEKELGCIANRKLESFKRMIERLNNQYLEAFGLRQKLFEFLWKYLEDDKKVTIVKSFRTKRTKYVEMAHYKLTSRYQSMEEYAEKMRTKIKEGLLSRCYDWRTCCIEYGKCHPDVGCTLRTNQQSLKREFKKIISIIYKYRSMFVHDARSPPFSGNKEILFVSDIYEGRPIMIELTLADFEAILEDTLKRCFDDLQS